MSLYYAGEFYGGVGIAVNDTRQMLIAGLSRSQEVVLLVLKAVCVCLPGLLCLLSGEVQAFDL